MMELENHQWVLKLLVKVECGQVYLVNLKAISYKLQKEK